MFFCKKKLMRISHAFFLRNDNIVIPTNPQKISHSDCKAKTPVANANADVSLTP